MSSIVPNTYRLFGRRGMPAGWALQMYQEYLTLRSLAKVGARHGRSRQSMYCIFKNRDWPLFSRKFQDVVEFDGRKYTPGKNGYLRDTIRRRGCEVQLHRVVWVKHHGPIPRGHQVGFKDGNINNCAIENLICLPVSSMSSLKATGANQFTKTAEARLQLLLRGKVPSLLTDLKARAA